MSLTIQTKIPLTISNLKTITIPQLGFGVYKIRGDACISACLTALSCGYRHIDSAQLYRNEAQVGEAIRLSGLQRSDIFITTKVGILRGSKDPTTIYQSLQESIGKLVGSGGYVDLFLIHVPLPTRAQRQAFWAALEKLHGEGKAKSIGVSNYHRDHIEEMKEYATLWPPSVNQIELHPWCQQHELVTYCNKNNIAVQAYSPLATGARLDDEVLNAIALKWNKTPAQVLVRYALQKGWVPLPKSSTASRIQENADVYDFELPAEDMAILDGLDEGPEGARFPANVDK